MKKITQLLKMNRAQLSLFAEAALSLALARFYVRFFAFKNYIYRVGEPLAQTEPEQIDFIVTDKNLETLRNISREIERAARNVPWNAVCLPQAMAGKWMLKRRNIPSLMFLGVAKERAATGMQEIEKELSHPGLKAHAWLKVGNFIVTGRQGHRQFTVVGRFR